MQDVVYQGDSFLMYARLEGGAEVSLRGVVRSATLAALPAVGGPVSLALEPERYGDHCRYGRIEMAAPGLHADGAEIRREARAACTVRPVLAGAAAGDWWCW